MSWAFAEFLFLNDRAESLRRPPKKSEVSGLRFGIDILGDVRLQKARNPARQEASHEREADAGGSEINSNREDHRGFLRWVWWRIDCVVQLCSLPAVLVGQKCLAVLPFKSTPSWQNTHVRLRGTSNGGAVPLCGFARMRWNMLLTAPLQSLEKLRQENGLVGALHQTVVQRNGVG